MTELKQERSNCGAKRGVPGARAGQEMGSLEELEEVRPTREENKAGEHGLAVATGGQGYQHP